jgi:integration host factor subunit alpha
VNQFLASRNTSGTLKQTGWRFRQGNFAIASPDGRCGSAYQGDGPQVFLLFLIMRCPPTVRLLIVLTLPPSYRCPLSTDYRPPGSCPRAAGWSAATLCLVELVLEEIADSVARGEAIKLSSFGTFTVRKKGQRTGRNPKTGVEVQISSRRVVVFKASAVMKQRINGEGAVPVDRT